MNMISRVLLYCTSLMLVNICVMKLFSLNMLLFYFFSSVCFPIILAFLNVFYFIQKLYNE